MTLENRDWRKYASLLGLEQMNSYKHWMKTVERLYITHDYDLKQILAQPSTSFAWCVYSEACLIAKAQPCFRASFDWLAPNRTNHDSRGTRHVQDGEVIGIRSDRIESFENVWAV